MSENPDERLTVTESSVTVQRSPRYFRFMFAGVLVFAVVALILTFVFPANPTYDRAQVFGFLLLVAIAVGVGVGSIVALVLDRAATRRARTVMADRLAVHVEPGETASGATAGTHTPIES